MFRREPRQSPKVSHEEPLSIALFTSLRFGSSHYRALEPLSELTRRGHRVVVTLDTASITPEVAACNVALVHRYQDTGAQRLMRDLRKAGLGIVWEHDDNVAAAPEHSNGGMRAQQTAAEIHAMVRLTDVVTTTNPALADSYRTAGAARIHVIENYLPRVYEDVRAVRSEDDVLVGWIAWADHQRDWDKLNLCPTMQSVLDSHPQVRIVSVGPVDLGLESPRYERKPPVPFSDLPAEIAHFDLGLAPLVDSPFNRCRSDVKVKEYAALGVPWLASSIGPYTNHGERQGGRLVASDAWEHQLNALVTDKRMRRRLSKQGKRWSHSHTLRTNVWRWEAALREAVACAQERRQNT